jgi:hypothetical protein
VRGSAFVHMLVLWPPPAALKGATHGRRGFPAVRDAVVERTAVALSSIQACTTAESGRNGWRARLCPGSVGRSAHRGATSSIDALARDIDGRRAHPGHTGRQSDDSAIVF